jgi:hypothetical protein
VNRALLDGLVDGRKNLGQEFPGRFHVLILNGFPDLPDAGPERRCIPGIDGFPADTAPFLPYRGLVMSHFFLL